MRQGNREDIDFKAERIEDHIFAMKKRYRGYRTENKHTEQPNLILGNVDLLF